MCRSTVYFDYLRSLLILKLREDLSVSLNCLTYTATFASTGLLRVMRDTGCQDLSASGECFAHREIGPHKYLELNGDCIEFNHLIMWKIRLGYDLRIC